MGELDKKKESNTTLRVWIAVLVGLIVAIMKGVLESKTFDILSIIGLIGSVFLLIGIGFIQKAINENTDDIGRLD